jgi:hypothetical protein
MFDAELKNVGHVSGSKMVTFIIDQGSKMDRALKKMKALITSCTKLVPATVELSEEEETYFDLIPHDMVEIQGVVVGGGNQHVEEVEQVPIMAFQMVARDSSPLAILAPRFLPDNQLSAPLAPDVAKTVDHVGVIPGPNGHEVSMPPPHAPSLATDRADHREERKQNKKEAKLKKRKDRE